MTNEQDYKYQPDPTCPYCGYLEKDAFGERDFALEHNVDAEISCWECGKDYAVQRRVTFSFSYSTPESKEQQP